MTQPGIRMERGSDVIGQRPGEDLNGAGNTVSHKNTHHRIQDHDDEPCQEGRGRKEKEYAGSCPVTGTVVVLN